MCVSVSVCAQCANSDRIIFCLTSLYIATCMNWTLLTLSIKCGWMNSISKALKRIKSNYWPIIEEKTHFQCKTIVATYAAATATATTIVAVATATAVFIVAVATIYSIAECSMIALRLHRAYVPAHPTHSAYSLPFCCSILALQRLITFSCTKTACKQNFVRHIVQSVALQIFHWENGERW